MLSHLFIKVKIEHDEDEKPEKLGNEICRQIQKIYGVRIAELSSATTESD